jgi:hypothetical protein
MCQQDCRSYAVDFVCLMKIGVATSSTNLSHKSLICYNLLTGEFFYFWTRRKNFQSIYFRRKVSVHKVRNMEAVKQFGLLQTCQQRNISNAQVKRNYTPQRGDNPEAAT